MFDYPVFLEPDGDTVLVTFPDVPEAITFGADKEEAMLQAVDALESALNGMARPPMRRRHRKLPTHPLESHLSALPRAPLMPFDATSRMTAAIPFAFDDYLELVDTTGRALFERKAA